MKLECAIGKIRFLGSSAGKFLARRINEEQIPILPSHIPLFFILPDAGESLLFNEVTAKWDVSKSSLSEMLNKYQKMGLIDKHVCSDDKRTVYLALTVEGAKIRTALAQFEAEFMRLLLLDFTQEERVRFEAQMDRAVKNAQKL